MLIHVFCSLCCFVADATDESVTQIKARHKSQQAEARAASPDEPAIPQTVINHDSKLSDDVKVSLSVQESIHEPHEMNADKISDSPAHATDREDAPVPVNPTRNATDASVRVVSPSQVTDYDDPSTSDDVSAEEALQIKFQRDVRVRRQLTR